MDKLENLGGDKRRKKRKSPHDDLTQVFQKVGADMGQLLQATDGNSNLEVRSHGHISDKNEPVQKC